LAKQKKEPTIKINDVDYKLDNLSDGAKAQLQGVRIADEEIKNLNIKLALTQTARNAYMQALQGELPE